MRFRWRDLLIPTAILTVLVCFFSELGTRRTALWVGHADVPLEFVLIDADSDQPIAGASLLLRDADFLDGPPKAQKRQEATSDPEGHARIIVPLQVSGADDIDRDGRFVRNVSRAVRYPHWQLDASADDYQLLTVSSEEFRGSYIADPRYHSDRNPPPITVRLRRQGR